MVEPSGVRMRLGEGKLRCGAKMPVGNAVFAQKCAAISDVLSML
jgi:hypothetical protein